MSFKKIFLRLKLSKTNSFLRLAASPTFADSTFDSKLVPMHKNRIEPFYDIKKFLQ